MDLKKQLKKMKKQQEKFERLVKQEQATCPHVSKKGKSRLEEFEEEGVKKGRCSRCGEVVIIDRELLGRTEVQMSADVVKTALAELRAQAHLGKIKLDSDEMEMMMRFDAEVLRDLPELMAQMTKTSKKPKGKNKKKKKNKRIRWS